jgi:hypothetical protein
MMCGRACRECYTPTARASVCARPNNAKHGRSRTPSPSPSQLLVSSRHQNIGSVVSLARLVASMVAIVSSTASLTLSPATCTLLSLPGGTYVSRITQCPADSLPGDLKHCSEDQVICVRHSSTRQEHRRGDFESLSQVCMQLRNEFRNLHLKKISFQLCLPKQITQYILTFYDNNDLRIREMYEGKVIIPILQSTTTSEDLHMDIGLVFWAATLSPKLQFQSRRGERCRLDFAVMRSNSTISCISSRTTTTPPGGTRSETSSWRSSFTAGTHTEVSHSPCSMSTS